MSDNDRVEKFFSTSAILGKQNKRDYSPYKFRGILYKKKREQSEEIGKE